MKNAKYKIGDIVTLEPYDKFIDHVNINKIYWKSQMFREIEIIEVVQSNMQNHYYYLYNLRFGWPEEFLKPRVFLADELFEI